MPPMRASVSTATGLIAAIMPRILTAAEATSYNATAIPINAAMTLTQINAE